MLALDVTDLVVRFGKISVLNGFSLHAVAGDRVSLVGANGAGKSTAVRAIAGVNRPVSGEIRVGDMAIAGRGTMAAIDAGVSLVPQGRRLFNSMTVRENLELGAYHRRRAEVVRRIVLWCDLFPEIAPILGRRAGHLSGGQQQLVSLVRGLMADPKILILDEPSMGVSPALVERIGERLVHLNETTGITVILVEQNLELARRVAQRVVVLAQGAAVEIASPDILQDPEKLSRYFFGANPPGDRPGVQ